MLTKWWDCDWENIQGWCQEN